MCRIEAMPSTSVRRAGLTAVALVVLCALLVRRASQPPAPVPASAPATEFSAERALAHVRQIAQRPHPIGTADNARVRDYVTGQLRSMGLDPQVQEATGVGTRYPEAGSVRNVLARLPGRTPGGPAVVLMAHYDGVPGGPAAGDDAAGTAAVLETVRALRASPPLLHDIVVLITDGEEAGLLGAAAFVREHPWAKDVGVTLNFEARGTTGRSYMFETGPGNLDVARVLRQAGDVSATSLSVTVYRSLPNDTDLSEMALLGTPALNFAFADGVERYHTAHDNVAYLNPGSVQHHGAQMLALARAFGDGPLPRPVTGDAVFFDMPLVGLIVYPEHWALPLALASAVLVLGAIVRLGRHRTPWVGSVLLGGVATLVSTGVAASLTNVVGNAIVTLHETTGWGGAAAFRGVYTAALAVLALGVSLACWAVVRRWASGAGAHAGALVVWAMLTLVVSVRLPGVSFLFVWPLVFAALAALATRPATARPTTARPADVAAPNVAGDVLLWIATAVGAAIIVPIVYALSAVLLGAAGPGGIAAGALVSLLAWLLAPQLEVLGGRRWTAAGVTLGAAALLACVGMATVRRSPAHPTPSVIVYAVDADTTTGAWFAARGPVLPETPAAVTSGERPPAWLTRLVGRAPVASYEPAERVAGDPPTATVVSDSTVGGERRLVLHVAAAANAEVINMRSSGMRVLRASIDGRAIDPSRYRGGFSSWQLDYNGPPPTGITLGLTIPAGSGVSLDLMSRAPELPTLPNVRIPSRPDDIVTIQTGDITIRHREVRIP
jgi:hypothetical protein